MKKIKTKRCWECGGAMEEYRTVDSHGVPYRYWECTKCGDRVLDMEQLEEAAKIYRKFKRHRVKVSRWGSALAIRIPKEIVKKQKIKAGTEVYFFPEKRGFRVIPERG